MRIAYLLGESLATHPGLKRKINGQIDQWLKNGHEVFRLHHLFGIIENPDGSVWEVDSRLSDSSEKGGKLSQMLRLSRQYEFAASALQVINPDITYSRYLFPALGGGKLMAHCGRLVLEINSDDETEYLAKSKLTGLFNKVFRGKYLRQAKGLVFVTRELACSGPFFGYTEARAVIANGIESEKIPFVRCPGNLSPQLVFIGSPGQLWHGLDKLVILAETLPECSIHVIGPSEQECVNIWGRLPNNVVMHGYLSAADAQEIISTMDVGISTLALHRKGMNEACPLKVREYMAHGLPILAASEDTDIQFEQNFYMRLPNVEHNIKPYTQQIAQFVYGAFGNAILREKVRQFAFLKMDVKRKEVERLRFFEAVLSAP